MIGGVHQAGQGRQPLEIVACPGSLVLAIRSFLAEQVFHPGAP